MGVLSWLARFPAASPSRPSERTRYCSEGGSTGRRANWPCHINIAKKVRLLRPSVQLPAGIHGSRGLYGFWPRWQGLPRQETFDLDLFVCISYKQKVGG